MNKIRFITSAALLIFAFVLIGEIYVWHVDSFETDYTYTTLYISQNTTSDEMKADIYESARKENVEVFTIVRKLENVFSEKITIYGTHNVETLLNDKEDILKGNYSSIFLGDIEVKFKDLSEIKDISAVEIYQLIGEKESIFRFKENLVNQYGGAIPREGYESNNSPLQVSIIWSVIFLMCGLMTLYRVALIKREISIRIISGQNLHYFVLKNILMDFGFYGFVFLISMLILKQYTNAKYLLSVSIMCLSAFLFINSLIYLTMYFSKYKRDMFTSASAKKVLKISYIYKVFSIMVMVIVMAGSIELINEGIQFYRQKEYFKHYENYSYVTLNTEDFQETTDISYDYYKEFSSEKKIAMVNLDRLASQPATQIVFADRGSVEYLEKKIKEIQKEHLEETVYFLIPEAKRKSISDTECKEIWEMYYQDEYKEEMIFYQDNVEVVSVQNTGEIISSLNKNPVIILNNMKPENFQQYHNGIYITRGIMFQESEEGWEEYLSENQLENEVCYKTNAYENYLRQWQILKRSMIIGIVCLFILFILEGIVIKTILHYEYHVNALELSLKKIFGYHLLSIHKKIIRTTVISGLLSLFGSLMIYHFVLDKSSFFYVAVGGVSVIIMELFLVFYYIRKLENVTIQKILKGGSL